jgi:membrane-associated phospholipid phosphatase
MLYSRGKSGGSRNWLLVALLAALWAFTCWLDRGAYHSLLIKDWNTQGALRDWAQFLRAAGYLPVWIFAGLLIECAPRRGSGAGPKRTRWLGWRVALAAGMGGLFAEILKLVVRRHRPSPVNDGQHVYDWFAPHVEGRGLGLASSHTAVAFAAASILWMWSPRAGMLAVLLASGCALTRMFAGAHFLSDVYAGAVLGWVAAVMIWNTADRLE